MSDRKVLCVEASKLFTNGAFFNGFVSGSVYRMPQAAKDSAHFRDKVEAELDHRYKQLIPYVTIFCPEKGAFLVYKRGKAGEEGRLHDLYSVGFGGHIEPFDMSNGDALSWVINRAMNRELSEELGLKIVKNVPSLIGYVNDEAKKVNQVHLGLVHNLIIDRATAMALQSGEGCIEGLEFVNVNDLSPNIDSDKFETWSHLVLAAYFANPSLYTMPPCPL